MSNQYQGGCHCGATRYNFTKPPELTFFCHCNDCQRTTGSPFAMELMIDVSSFSVDGPLKSYVVVGDSGKPVTRWHCDQCGSGIYLDCEMDPDYVFVKVGSLDDAAWVEPQMHIYTVAKQPWIQINDDLPCYEKLPPE